ncbi:MAG TPA: dihydropteroate synthase [Kribbellaceae bacterium]|jgi:dihydropteroate synthase
MTVLRARDVQVTWSTPLLMGILNLNPDSFSDPGPRSTDAALDRALSMIASGARIIDVGAQSSITGRRPVDADAEIAAVVPVIRELVRADPRILLSVDTFKIEVAEAALGAGAHIINDVSGLLDPAIAVACARHGAALIIMHTTAPPLTRRQDPGLYADVTVEAAAFLAQRAETAIELGVAEQSIIVDPGPDFTKTPAQTIELLRNIHHVVALGYPVLLALSRKDFIGALTGQPPAGRDAGTLGALAAMSHVPDQIVRVHDVAAARDMLTVLNALTGTTPIPSTLTLAEELRHQPPGVLDGEPCWALD